MDKTVQASELALGEELTWHGPSSRGFHTPEYIGSITRITPAGTRFATDERGTEHKLTTRSWCCRLSPASQARRAWLAARPKGLKLIRLHHVGYGATWRDPIVIGFPDQPKHGKYHRVRAWSLTELQRLETEIKTAIEWLERDAKLNAEDE